MNIIQVDGNIQGSGKSSIIGALSLYLREKGKKVSYYKPFSSSASEDPDPPFIAIELLGVSAPVHQVTPPDGPITPELEQTIKANIEKSSASTDTLFIEGPDIDSANGVLGQTLHGITGGKRILVSQWDKNSQDNLSSNPSSQEAIIINGYPLHRSNMVSSQITDATDNGTPIIGAIPEDRFMLSVEIQQILDHLDGTWFDEPENTRQLVQKFLIGGNIMDSGPNYFCRHNNQAVITRAERPDIHMACFKGDTKCVIMTGGGKPTEYVQIEARNLDIPLIMVESNTMNTAQSLEGLAGKSVCHNVEKIRHFKNLIEGHLDMQKLDSILL